MKNSAYRQRWGLAAALHNSLVQRLSRVLGLRLYNLYSWPLEDGPDEPDTAEFTFRQFFPGDHAALLAVARHPDLGIDERFVQRAFGKGDMCTAVLHQGEIVAFNWLAYSPTHDQDGVFIDFDGRSRYAYFAYTLPAFRGRDLHKIFSARRDRDALNRGCERSISFISVDNRSSMRAALKVGAHRVGLAGYLKKGPLMLAFRSRKVRDAGVRFVKPKAGDPRFAGRPAAPLAG
jgi:hypothetical protein